MYKVLLTAGTWNFIKNESNNFGKKSHLIEKMYHILKEEKDFSIDYFNGGNYEELSKLVEQAKEYDVIFWMANVPNELPKVRDVKKVNPFAIVIGSKRNHCDISQNKMEYTFVEILNKSLLQRNNLTIEFSKLKDSKIFKMLLFDPLGTSWYDGYDLNLLIKNMLDRIRFIMLIKRERTYSINETHPIPENEEFFSYVRNVAEIFHKTIEHADGVTRFLGNASFKQGNKIYVTRRDVDKTLIDKNNFVECFLDNNKVFYYGENKPSKDTVVQARLYNMFPNVNFIVHSHCYAKDGYFTKIPVPCGALDEIDEIVKVIKNNYENNYFLDNYKINLNGHGCILLSNSVNLLKQTEYITRHLPEYLK